MPLSDHCSPVLLSDRLAFPHLLNHMQLLGEGCEVGVFNGYYSGVILKSWRGKRLYSIDPYRSFDKSTYLDKSNLKQDDFETIFAQARATLSPYGERSQFVRKTSVEAAPDFADESLDFAYLDGNHSYEAVAEDIAAWYPKVKPGGLLSGHDYIADGIYKDGDFGVRQAVAEFAAKTQLNVYQTAEPFSTWIVQKPLPPEATGIRLDNLFLLMDSNNSFLTRRIAKLEHEVQLMKAGSLRFLLRQPRKFFKSLLERSH